MICVPLLVLFPAVQGLIMTQRCVRHTVNEVRHRAIRADFGDKCYEGSIEPLPTKVYEVMIERPLGIGFEENGPNFGKNGVSVSMVVEGSNAAKGQEVMKNVGGVNTAVPGRVQVGDRLVGVTAIQLNGAKWERKMFDCRKWDFDTVVDAINSNEEKFVSNNVIMQFLRLEEADGEATA